MESCRFASHVYAPRYHNDTNISLGSLFLSLCQGDEESFILKSCTRRKTDSIEKRFCFDVEAVDRSVSV